MRVAQLTTPRFDVYIVTDASGGTTKEAHDMAVQRMIQAGAIPVTWQQVLLEYQRDWSRREHYNEGTAFCIIISVCALAFF